MAKSKQRDSVPQYSYRQSLKKDEVKTYKRIALILTGFFVILVIVWFMGTTFINALSFLSNGNTNQNSPKNITTLPLLTPRLDGLPEATNSDNLTIQGETTSGVDVTLTVNGKETDETVADSSGDFEFKNVKLVVGDNLIKVIASNQANEKEETSATVKVDKTRPGLALTSPVDGASLPSSTKNINVSGSTEAEAVVHVSGSQAVVDSSGKFTFNMPVSTGVNQIEVTSTDLAGNITTVKISVTVEGEQPAETPQ